MHVEITQAERDWVESRWPSQQCLETRARTGYLRRSLVSAGVLLVVLTPVLVVVLQHLSFRRTPSVTELVAFGVLGVAGLTLSITSGVLSRRSSPGHRYLALAQPVDALPLRAWWQVSRTLYLRGPVDEADVAFLRSVALRTLAMQPQLLLTSGPFLLFTAQTVRWGTPAVAASAALLALLVGRSVVQVAVLRGFLARTSGGARPADVRVAVRPTAPYGPLTDA